MDSRQWARNQVRDKISKSDGVSFFYKECLRFIISKLGDLSYSNSEDKIQGIKCIYANPERVVAKLNQETNIILPILSISQTVSNNDDKRRRNSFVIVDEHWWSEKKKRSFRVLSSAPRPVTIDYSINIWSKYRSDLDQITEQVRLLFNPDLVIVNKFTTTVKAFLVDESDQSNVDASDREDRLLRRSFSIKLEGYIPTPKFLVTSTGEIEEILLDSTLS